MVEPISEVRRAWREVAGDGHDDVLDDLVARHRERHRHYHTLGHTAAVVRRARELADRIDRPVDADAVTVAALFHDAIYDPRSAANEADSAALAVAAVTALGWPSARSELVASLIEATAGHHATTNEAAILLDADLAILGATPSVYALYAMNVRAEYAHVTEERWRVGRAAVLEGFLDRDRIFATDALHAELETQARVNLSAELRALGGDPTTGER